MVFLVIPGLITLVMLPGLRKQAVEAASYGQETMTALSVKDFDTAKERLSLTYESLLDLEKNYAKLKWWAVTPFRFYYQDGGRLLFAAKGLSESGIELFEVAEPHQAILGMGEPETELLAEDRIMSLLLFMAEVQPALESLNRRLTQINAEIQKISPSRYPVTLEGRHLPSEIKKAQEKLFQLSGQLDDSLLFVQKIPRFSGMAKPITYLMIFQNDGEIRPTGGFMTAFSAIQMEQGVVNPLKSDDIYKLDAKFTEFIPPPEPIEKYLPLVQQWHLRDMNLSPDFRESMETFLPYYDSLPEEEPVEAVIGIDTDFLIDLLRVLGPVEIEGYGTFSAENEPKCNCPQVVYGLENIATRPSSYVREDRKAVLGVLMEALIEKLYGAPGEVWPDLMQFFYKQLSSKHILFYFRDPELQEAVEKANFAGRIKSFDGDYLHVNNANFAGAKSNFFISDEIEQRVERLNGNTLKKTVTLTYKNPFPADNCNAADDQLCLNSIYRSYMRVYVPKGSRLIESFGFAEGSIKEGEEFGLSRFEGFYTLAPQSQVKLTLIYEMPYAEDKDYRLLFQKQPGTREIKHTLITGNNFRDEIITSDRIFSLAKIK